MKKISAFRKGTRVAAAFAALVALPVLRLSVAAESALPAAPPPRISAPITAAALPSRKEVFHIFLLMGQSNMAGYGGIARGDPYLPGDKDPVAGVLVLDGQGTHASGEPLEPIAWRPGAHRLHLHQDTAQFGLGMDFAKEYIIAHPGITVGLVPCAWGGDEISGLQKGTPIYSNAMLRVAFARTSGTIKGVLWHQGESDSVDWARVSAYEAKLRALIRDLRTDCAEPDLPFIIGNLAEFYGVCSDHSPRINLINQIRGILYRVGTDTPNAAFVATTGLESADRNYVHFSRSSYIELGKRYAQAVLAIQHRNAVPPRD